MEENRYESCYLHKHPIMKHVLVGLLVFLGAFSAFYVVADWHFKRMLDPAIQMRNMDRAMMKQEHRMDKLMQKEMSKNFRPDTTSFVKVNKEDDVYKIVVDLRPFGNDEKNVEVRPEGNSIVINAANEKNARNGREITKYSQTFSFGEKINSANITIIREGKDYVIIVPID